jgi:hypothetical protein
MKCCILGVRVETVYQKTKTYHGIRILRGFQWKKVIFSWDLSQPYNKER